MRCMFNDSLLEEAFRVAIEAVVAVHTGIDRVNFIAPVSITSDVASAVACGRITHASVEAVASTDAVCAESPRWTSSFASCTLKKNFSYSVENRTCVVEYIFAIVYLAKMFIFLISR